MKPRTRAFDWINTALAWTSVVAVFAGIAGLTLGMPSVNAILRWLAGDVGGP